MGVICLKLLLDVFMIFTVAKALGATDIATDADFGDCTFASSDDRLPLNVMVPRNYNFTFIVNPNFNSFFGTCDILLHIVHLTRTIRLHAYKLVIHMEQIRLTEISKISDRQKSRVPVNYRYCEASQMLDLQFEDDIYPALYYLHINFTTPLNAEQYEGLTWLEPIECNLNPQGWFFTSLFVPIAGRKMFPCWDEPNVRTTFQIAILHPTDFTVLSNMGGQVTTSNITKNTWTRFNTTPLITVSEVVIVIIDNGMKQIGPMRDTMWHCAESSAALKFARFVINSAKISFSKYTSHGMSFNHIVIPKSPVRATGSSGIIIYREWDIVFYEGSDFRGVQASIEMLIVREMARQWFSGNTIPSWTDMWISESFATYFSYSFPIEPTFHSDLDELFVVQVLQPALHFDVDLQMKPVAHEIINVDEIHTSLYSRFYHYKGSVLMRMLQHILPQSQFERKIGQYLEKTLHGPIVGNDLWKTMEGANDIKKNPRIKDIMSGWSQQRYYPEVYVDYNDRYHTANITTICQEGANWHIPISIIGESNDECVRVNSTITWMRCNESKIFSDPAWEGFIIINFKQIGYYRVNYDSNNFERIAMFLKYNNYTCIPVHNRAQLIDDVYHFAIADKTNAYKFYWLIQYLKRETRFVPWYPMFNILSYMSTFLEHPAGKFVRPIILESLSKLLKKIKYEEYYWDSGATKALRLLATRWSCKLGDNECKKIAKTILSKKFLNPHIEFLPWWKEWVYCSGMMQLDANMWMQMLNISTNSSDITTFKYLSCTDNSTLFIHYAEFLRTYQNMSNLMEDIELIEHYRLSMKKHLKNDTVFNYVLKHFSEIADRFFQNDAVYILWGDIIWNSYTTHRISQITKFSEKVHPMYTLGYREFEKLINARLSQLNKINAQFFKF